MFSKFNFMLVSFCFSVEVILVFQSKRFVSFVSFESFVLNADIKFSILYFGNHFT